MGGALSMAGGSDLVARGSCARPPAAGARDGPIPARLRQAAVAAAALVVLATPLAAQPWRGSLRASGVVRGPDGRPVEGAAVRLALREEPGEGPPPATADRRGRWAVLGLTEGVWRIAVTADGFFPAEGEIALEKGRGSRPIEITLRSLDEATPTFYEGNPATIVRWIEAGNLLLVAGRTADARAEYQKALAALPPQERPEVLQAVARAWYLEGEIDRAVETLGEALALAPGDARLRALVTEVLEQAGRGGEAAGRIAAAEQAGAEAGADERAAVSAGRPQLPPLVAAVPGSTGARRIRLASRHPLSAVEVWEGRTGTPRAEIEAADPHGGEYDLARESFEIYVPESYRDGEPHGLLVWVSPTPFGGFRSPAIAEALERHRVIWVGADAAGNGRFSWNRAGLALDAAYGLRDLYAIDPLRVWIAGFSGGSRVASALALLWTEVFRGAALFSGADYFESVAVPDRPGARWPPRFARPPRPALERVKQESRIVQIAGEHDFNRAQTRAVAERMRRDGFRLVTYLEVPGADHLRVVDPATFDRALALLDAER